ncbi:hypothetical protein ACFO9Q_19620 [Paenibacillus sp. GCM10023252]|uniref:hypothetical protein n=1 Tax=Paenibacillus sp. GCM10023252 TaxID=3252649 RepID=UPI003616E742
MQPVPSFIQINTIAKYDRHQAIDDAKRIIQDSGGWVNDYKMLSNKSICLQFEMSQTDAVKLYPDLKQTSLILYENTEETLQQLTELARQSLLRSDKDLRGTFQITFVHDEPDLILDVPAFDL